MRAFCDSSVLVAASVRRHPHYPRARPILEDVATGRLQGIISAHSVAEVYSALTSMPVMPRILPTEAQTLVTRNVLPHFQLVAVTAAMYTRALEVCVGQGVGGGKIYDALLIECARASNAERIYTFNLGDFRLIAPDLANRLTSP